MEKKYKLTGETINVMDRTLYRIEALKDFGDVKKGDKDGFIEKEENLSQYDDCWVYGHAKVYGDAEVFGNVKVCDNASVFGNATVHGNARICSNAQVYDNAKVYGNAVVYDKAQIYGNVEVHNNAMVCGNAEVYDNAMVYDNAKVYGNARVYGNAEIVEDAKVESAADYIVFKNWWSSGRYFTWTRSNNMWKVGCFYGTGEQLIEKAYKDSVKSGEEYEKIVRYSETVN